MVVIGATRAHPDLLSMLQLVIVMGIDQRTYSHIKLITFTVFVGLDPTQYSDNS